MHESRKFKHLKRDTSKGIPNSAVYDDLTQYRLISHAGTPAMRRR